MDAMMDVWDTDGWKIGGSEREDRKNMEIGR